MNWSMALVVAASLLIGGLVVAVVVLSIYYSCTRRRSGDIVSGADSSGKRTSLVFEVPYVPKSSDLTLAEWADKLRKRWLIDVPGNPFDGFHPDYLSRLLLFDLMRRNVMTPSECKCGEPLKGEWYQYPYSLGAMDLFNPTTHPTMSHTIMRSTNSRAWARSPEHAALVDLATGEAHMLDIGNLATATTRRDATGGKVVVEDVRFIVYSSAPMDDTVLASATIYSQSQTQMGLFQFSSEKKTLEHLKTFESPYGRSCEKNWIFVKDASREDYLVFYHADPLQIFNLTGADFTMSQSPIKNIPWLPRAWDAYTAVAEMRMTSVHYVNDNRELLLLLHHVGPDHTYTYFCLYLDSSTLDPVAYIPAPVLRDIAPGVKFVMDGREEHGKYKFSIGVADIIGGQMTYDKNAWEAMRTVVVSK